MEHFDSLISVLVSVVLAVCGVLVHRAMSQLDDAIERLWAEADACRERASKLTARVSVLEALKGLRSSCDDDG